jgi:hypothetical protein
MVFTIRDGLAARICCVSAEEVVLILDDEAEVTAGDDRMRLGARGIALVPATVPHDLRNAGECTLRVWGLLQRGCDQPLR